MWTYSLFYYQKRGKLLFLIFSAKQRDQKDILCGPCLYVDIKTKATRYCKTCDDSEPLCNDCAKQHTRQKSSRDHELGDDIRTFYDNQKGSNAK